MSDSIEYVRAKATEIIARIQAEPEFKAQVEANPESALVSAGLPADAVADFLADNQLASGEVSGYLVSGGGCTYTCTNTCGNTGCTITI